MSIRYLATLGAAAALTGLFTFNEILLLQSAVDPFLSALAIWTLARAFDRGRAVSFFGAGVSLGLLVVNRPNSLAAVARRTGAGRAHRTGLRDGRQLRRPAGVASP